MALTTPPFIGLVALLVGRIRRMRVIALVQDVYPDVAVALGALKADSLTARLLDWLNRFLLRRADRIVVLGDCMRERIAEKVGSSRAARIDVIHNWADGREIAPVAEQENSFAAEHDLAGRFVVLFSGNLGRVNEFSTVLESARLLSDEPNVLFLFIGEGAKAVEVKEFCRSHWLGNVRLLPYQPRHMLRYSLAAADVSLVTLADGLAGLSVPSKTYGIMAAGRSVLFVGDPESDIARLVKETGCGEAVASGDSARLAELIRGWATDGKGLAEVGQVARRVFEERFDRPHAVSAYLQTFAKCMEAAPTRPGEAITGWLQN
jgi:glycosyltransferase involved in cell wall biosynthesis